MSILGYNKIGSTSASTANYVGTKIVAAETGVINSISFYTKAVSGSVDCGAAIYSDVGGQPTSILAKDSGNVSVGTTPGWFSVNINLQVTKGVTYWIFYWSSASRTIYYDSGPANQYYVNGGTFENWLATESAGTFFARQVSIFATYTIPNVGVRINSFVKTSVIDWESIRKTEVLTKEPDTLEFSVKNYPTRNYVPNLGDNVELFNYIGSTQKNVWTSGDSIPTFSPHISNGSPVLTPTIVNDYLNLSFYMSVPSGNGYLYSSLSSIANYTVQEGDILEYDVYWETSGNIQIAIDLTCSDSTALRGLANDQNGIGSHPSSDLSPYAYGKWYHRKIPLDSIVRKLITNFDVVCESDSAGGTFVGRIKNIQITKSDILFAGVVVEADNEVDGLLNYNSIVCKDWTHLADQKLVSRTYANKTVAYIAADIIATYCPAGFTSINVIGTTVIDSIVFNYVTVTSALQKLISAAGGGYDYYFDYFKDLHFFPTGYYAAPYSLSDTSGNYNFQSLKIADDLTQLRNKITVRGGLTNGTQVINLQKSDGVQVVFFVGYNLTSFLAYKALAASPSSFSALTVGADGKDNPASFDCLYNPDKGLLIWPDASKPAVNDVIKYSGIPSFPVIVQLQNDVSISTYGAYEFLLIDNTIISKNVARSRAVAQLLQYSLPLVTGSFTTRTPGLKAGQVIPISSALRNISGSYKIQRINTVLRTPSAVTSDFVFDVEVVSTVTLTMNDVLKKLLLTDPTDQVVVGQNEIVDTVYSETEAILFAETNTPQALNYPVQFVAGPQHPSGYKRVFIIGGSPLK